MDDGNCLNDTQAICHYLESRFPEPNLMGRDGREQALILEAAGACQTEQAGTPTLQVFPLR